MKQLFGYRKARTKNMSPSGPATGSSCRTETGSFRFLYLLCLLTLLLTVCTAMPSYAASKKPPMPTFEYKKKVTNETQKVYLRCKDEKAVIYYTTDGTTPVKGKKTTKKYTKPLKIKKTTEILCRAYRGKKKSKVARLKIICLAPVKIKKLELIDGGVRLTWKQTEGAQGYRIYRRTVGKKKWTYIKKIKSGKTTTYLDKSIKWNKKYAYYITSYRGKLRSVKKDNTERISTKHTKHNFVEYKLDPPDCFKEGLRTLRCTVCTKLTTESVPKLEHVPGEKKDGYYTLSVCTLCNTELERYLARDIPLYWNDEIVQALQKASARGALPGFTYFTDIHWNTNVGNSPAIVNFVTTALKSKMAVCGGDIVTSHHDKAADAIAEMQDFYSKVTVNLLSTTGNHDWNSSSNSDTSQYLSEATINSLMHARAASFTYLPGQYKYGYTDDKANQVRYIMFFYDDKSAVPEETLAWIEARVKELSASWHVVLFSHAYWHTMEGDLPTVGKRGTKLANRLLKIQAESDATIALWLVGHIHRDCAAKLSGTVEVETGAAGSTNGGTGADDGTSTASGSTAGTGDGSSANGAAGTNSGSGTDSGNAAAETTTKSVESKLLVVSTSCDKFSSISVTGVTRKKKTSTEQVIDLVQLDKAKRIVYFTRVGAGADRSYKY